MRRDTKRFGCSRDSSLFVGWKSIEPQRSRWLIQLLFRFLFRNRRVGRIFTIAAIEKCRCERNKSQRLRGTIWMRRRWKVYRNISVEITLSSMTSRVKDLKCKFLLLKSFLELRHKICIKWLFSQRFIYLLLIAAIKSQGRSSQGSWWRRSRDGKPFDVSLEFISLFSVTKLPPNVNKSFFAVLASSETRLLVEKGTKPR